MRAPDGRPSAADLGRFTASLVALVVLAVVLPAAALATLDRRFGSPNPVAGLDPPWRWDVAALSDRLREPLTDGLVSDVLLRLCAGLIVVASLIIVATTLSELVHHVRHGGIPRPALPGLGWAQAIGRRVAIGLLVVVPLTTTAPIASTIVPAAPPSDDALTARPDDGRLAETTGAFAATTARSGASPPVTDEGGQEHGPTLHVVARGESVWSIAAGMADGDERRTAEIADRILDVNLGKLMSDGRRFTTPAFIGVGWELVLPDGHATTGFDRGRPVPGRPGAIDAADSTSVHTVVAGDTLFEIAATQLGDGRRWTSIWELNAGTTMLDGRTFDDPDLIVPGWELRIPRPEPTAPSPIENPTADPSEPSASPASRPRPVDSSSAEPATDPPPVDPPVTVAAESPSADSPAFPAAAGHATVSAPSATASTTATPTTLAATEGGAGADEDSGHAPSVDPRSPIRLEHAAVLAAGILALIGVRRRARLRAAAPHSRIPEPSPEHLRLERRLRITQSDDLDARLDVAIRAAAATIADTDAQIGSAEVAPDGDVRLQLTAAVELPAPWSGIGSRWTLPARVPLDLVAPDARRVEMPCPAMVQLGMAEDGATVLVDLEACGALAIDGPSAVADQITNAIATGLATSVYAETVNLITVGVDENALLDHRNARSTATVKEAIDHAGAFAAPPAGRTVFSLRALRTGGEAWEPTIVLIDSATPTDELAARTWPLRGAGVAVVVAQQIPESDAVLRFDERGWSLHAFDTELRLAPVGLPDDALAVVAEAVQHCGDPSGECPTAPATAVAADVRTLDEPVDAPAHAEPEIVVELLGPVRVVDHRGAPAHFERSKTMELIAWLATHRTRATRSGARAALWEIDVRDATFANVVSEARRGLARLVAPPDGEEWIPRTLSDELPLDRRVVTDIEIIQRCVDEARRRPPAHAIATLRPAVERIRGLPFAGTSYLWPDAEGIASQFVLIAITAACDLASHALSSADIELVFWATGKGLAVLPGHEELVGMRMRAHARAGDRSAVRDEWERYERIIHADPWSDGEPAPKLVELRHDLLSSTGD